MQARRYSLRLQSRQRIGADPMARGCRMKLMTQFQAQIPRPLTDDLPCLLSPGGMAAPTVRILLHVFIGERRFKGAAMQIQRDHIGSRKGGWRQIGQEELVDHTVASYA